SRGRDCRSEGLSLAATARGDARVQARADPRRRWRSGEEQVCSQGCSSFGPPASKGKIVFSFSFLMSHNAKPAAKKPVAFKPAPAAPKAAPSKPVGKAKPAPPPPEPEPEPQYEEQQQYEEQAQYEEQPQYEEQAQYEEQPAEQAQ